MVLEKGKDKEGNTVDMTTMVVNAARAVDRLGIDHGFVGRHLETTDATPSLDRPLVKG